MVVQTVEGSPCRVTAADMGLTLASGRRYKTSMVARPPASLRLKILGGKLDRAVASRDEQGLAELDDLAY